MKRLPARAAGSADSGAIPDCLPILIQMPSFHPAGLELYWVTNTLLSIARQRNINRRIEAKAKKDRAG